MDSLISNLKNLIGIKTWNYAERRKAVRVPCRIEATVQKGDGVAGAEIRNIGTGGLGILCFDKLKKGDTVHVRSLNSHLQVEHNTIQCRVEWTKKQGHGLLIGVSFQEFSEVLNKSWLIFELKELGIKGRNTKQKRDDVRVKCLIPGYLNFDGDLRSCRIQDLGRNGARVECPGQPVPEGSRITLKFGPLDHLPKVMVEADVVSLRNFGVFHYGLSFVEFTQGGPKAVDKYLKHYIV